MKYTCPDCGWVKENKEMYSVTSEDFKEIFEHEKTHKKKK